MRGAEGGKQGSPVSNLQGALAPPADICTCVLTCRPTAVEVIGRLEALLPRL